MCHPPANEIYSRILSAVKSVRAVSVFVASDNDHMIENIQRYMENKTSYFKKIVKLDDDNPQLDLAILGRSSIFIGNCISSFSAFVKRERDAKKAPTIFFGLVEKKHFEL